MKHILYNMLSYRYELIINENCYPSYGTHIFVKKKKRDLNGNWSLHEYNESNLLRKWDFIFADSPLAHIRHNKGIYINGHDLSVIADHKNPYFDIIFKNANDIFDTWYIKLGDEICLETIFIDTVASVSFAKNTENSISNPFVEISSQEDIQNISNESTSLFDENGNIDMEKYEKEFGKPSQSTEINNSSRLHGRRMIDNFDDGLNNSDGILSDQDYLDGDIDKYWKKTTRSINFQRDCVAFKD